MSAELQNKEELLLWLSARPELVEPLYKIVRELHKAETKHPTWGTDAAHAIGYLTEEVGESAKEINDFNTFGWEACRKSAGLEIAQAGAVSLRMLLNLDRFKATKGE